MNGLYKYAVLVPLLLLLSVAVCPPLSAGGADAGWTLADGCLRRSWTSGDKAQSRKWRIDRISWFPFIAWEENREEGPAEHVVWVDTPGAVRYMKVGRGHVLRTRLFKKGKDKIPKALRPTGRKILWVLLDDKLVRKVIERGKSSFEWTYPKDAVPLHPFICAQETGVFKRRQGTVELTTDKYRCTMVFAGGKAVSIHSEFTSGQAYRLPRVTRKNHGVPGTGKNVKSAPHQSAGSNRRRKKEAAACPPHKRAIENHAGKGPPGAARRQDSSHEKHLNAGTLSACADLLSCGRPHSALVELKKLRKRFPRSAKLLFLMGRADFLLGRYGEAQRLFKRASMLRPGWYAPRTARAEMLCFRERTLEALRILQEFPRRAFDAGYHRAMASVLLCSRDAAKAVDEALKALELSPGDPVALLLLGRAYNELQKSSPARDAYREVIRLAASDAAWAFARPILTAPKPHQVNSELQPIEVRPSGAMNLYFVAAFLLGCMEFNCGDFTSAAQAFTQAYIAAPDSQSALFNCALSYERAGDEEQARQLFSRLLSMYPDNEKARNLIKPTGAKKRNVKYRQTASAVDSQLDRLFASIKESLENPGEIKARPKGADPLENDKRAKIRLRSVDVCDFDPKDRHLLKALSLPPDTRQLPEIRCGGLGEERLVQGCSVRLVPSLVVPAMARDDSADVLLRLVLSGRVSTGDAKACVIELGFSREASGDPREVLASCRIRQNRRAEPIWLSIEGRVAAKLLCSPTFCMSVYLEKDENNKREVFRQRVRLKYCLNDKDV